MKVFLGGGAFFNAIWYFAKLEFDIIVRGKIYQGQSSKTSQTVEFALLIEYLPYYKVILDQRDNLQ